MKNYEKQAIDFLNEMGASFEAKYLRHDSMPWDEKGDRRDIYKCTIKRGRRKYSSEFGQSILKSGILKVSNTIAHDSRMFKYNDIWVISAQTKKESNIDTTKLIEKREEPTAYDFLACLTKYDPGAFSDFCKEFGYDEDSRKAEKTYKGVLEEYMGVCALFNDAEMAKLQEIQ